MAVYIYASIIGLALSAILLLLLKAGKRVGNSYKPLQAFGALALIFLTVHLVSNVLGLSYSLGRDGIYLLLWITFTPSFLLVAVKTTKQIKSSCNGDRGD